MADSDHTLDTLLEFVKETRGFDFTGYKRSSIQRRVAKRMNDVGVAALDDYIAYLQMHGDEFSELFNTVLINVTSFFRDESMWEFLAEDVLPGLVHSRPPGAPRGSRCSPGTPRRSPSACAS